ncbi:hypothetical protein [Serratia sp. JSRIV006]|uniref:hypothetical protein n=1 Tax=Serratia sp. JSRIV006 TaxID=2831896 RepID=UPI001CBFE1B2|nr:hypothetical protein [Serratia sp. JSRIV006]UAN65845.1 hypothetical protein KGP16_26675 [Serratia sp. JSRIV006]
MKTFLVYTEDLRGRETLTSILKKHFNNGIFEQLSIAYENERNFIRIDLSDNVTIEMMKFFISEVPEGHQMHQILATNFKESELNWREVYPASDGYIYGNS